MSVPMIDQNNFIEHIEKNSLMVVKFGAPWCGPCKALAPLLDRASEQFPGVAFFEVNVEQSPTLAAGFNVRSLPTLMAWKNGVIQWTKIGLPNVSDLNKALQELAGN